VSVCNHNCADVYTYYVGVSTRFNYQNINIIVNTGISSILKGTKGKV